MPVCLCVWGGGGREREVMEGGGLKHSLPAFSNVRSSVQKQDKGGS